MMLINNVPVVYKFHRGGHNVIEFYAINHMQYTGVKSNGASESRHLLGLQNKKSVGICESMDHVPSHKNQRDFHCRLFRDSCRIKFEIV